VYVRAVYSIIIRCSGEMRVILGDHFKIIGEGLRQLTLVKAKHECAGLKYFYLIDIQLKCIKLKVALLS